MSKKYTVATATATEPTTEDCGCHGAAKTTAPALMPAGAERSRWRYVGPYYERGIQLSSGNLLRPNDWTDEEVDAKLADHPEYAAWFCDCPAKEGE